MSTTHIQGCFVFENEIIVRKFIITIVSVVELALAMALQAIHQAPSLKTIKTEEAISKRKKDKLEKVSQTFGRVQWIMEKFGEKLKLSAFGLDV